MTTSVITIYQLWRYRDFCQITFTRFPVTWRLFFMLAGPKYQSILCHSLTAQRVPSARVRSVMFRPKCSMEVSAMEAHFLRSKGFMYSRNCSRPQSTNLPQKLLRSRRATRNLIVDPLRKGTIGISGRIRTLELTSTKVERGKLPHPLTTSLLAPIMDG